MQESVNEGQREKRGDSLTTVVDLLSSLTSPDALQIFLKAEEGIRSSTRTMQELGLTQKRYYVWLKRLIDAGLVEKKHGKYQQTLLGKVCAKLGKSLQDTLLQSERLDLAETLLNSATLSAMEKKDVLHALSKNGTQSLFSITDILYPVKTIVDYDVFIDESIKLLDETRERAYVATTKPDPRVKDALFKLIDRDITLYALSVEANVSENIELMKIVLPPSSLSVMKRLLTTKDLNLRVRKSLSYGFVVSDKKRGIIEMPHPLSHEFYVAFQFNNVYLTQRLIEVFTALYEDAKEDPQIEFARKTLGISKPFTGKKQDPTRKQNINRV
jgi:predicted transcriptional regulator